MVETFVSPPMVCRPWVYWWWLNANVTEESITREARRSALVDVAQVKPGFDLNDDQQQAADGLAEHRRRG